MQPFRIRQTAAVLLATILAACSTVQTRPATVPLAAIQRRDRLQLLVRTGNSTLDQFLYEIVYEQFSDVLPLREKPPYTGTMEVTFTSSTQSAFLASSSTVASASAQEAGWYTASGYLGQKTAMGTSSTLSSGGTFDWQNSTMLMVVKRADGQRLWTADYDYKGGWELSGWVVNTPEEAARLVAQRLRARFLSDFRSR